VVLLTTGLARAGAEKQLVLLARQLRERGDEVLVVKMLPSDGYVPELQALGVTVTTLKLRPGARALSFVASGTRLLRAWQPDVLISFVYQAAMLGRIAGRLGGVPVIISSLRNERQKARRRDLLLKLTDRLGSVTTTNSTLTAEALTRSGTVDPDRLIVIPNGIEVAHYGHRPGQRAAVRRELGIREHEFLWLAAGRLAPQKDFDNLLAAAALLARDGRLGQLRIAGRGPLEQSLAQRITELRIADRVALLGLREDLPAVMAAADGFVLSSAYEGLPNVVMEALASGLPVVGTRVGGTAELVQEQVSGFLVPPRDAAALAAAMDRLARTPEDVRRQMGAAGRVHVAAHYSVGHARDSWLALIDRCEQEARGSRRGRLRAPALALAHFGRRPR
jgi:glycosyltransferase involved in cell wall biosynthesis